MMVLITGACGGLGRTMAAECAQRGYNLFLTDMNEKGLVDLSHGLTRLNNVKVLYKSCNLADVDSERELFNYIDKMDIHFDMLLNIAGIDFEGSFVDQDHEKLARIVRVNIEGTLRMTHQALKRRNPESRFNIVIVSSLGSISPIPLKATYAASKRFLLDFSIALREELRNRNASVLALCPGGLPTTQEAIDGILAQGLWGRLTTNSLCSVAHKTISLALAGKPVFIPGAINYILCFLSKLLPRTVIAKLLYNRWKDAHEKNPGFKQEAYIH